MGKIRGTHSSPGVYTKITDVTYPSQSVGMTTLGVVGETLKGPAFEPIMVKNWSEYKQYFGGTSAEKFPETNYPKYELPYIAKSYLSESDQLYVSRVLGLSGYYAGSAWAITAQKGDNGDKYVVAILRSKADYKTGEAGCVGKNKKTNDYLDFKVTGITLSGYTNYKFGNKCGEISVGSGETSGWTINTENYGRFNITCKGTNLGSGVTYSVSLNPDDKDYIIDVLGVKPDEGNTPIYVEELYDYSLKELIENGDVNKISSGVTSITGKTTYDIVNVEANSSNELNEITNPVASNYPTQDMEGNLYVLCSSGGGHYTFYDETKTATEPMIQGGVYTVKKATKGPYVEGNKYNFEEIIKGLNLLDGYSDNPKKRKTLGITFSESTNYYILSESTDESGRTTYVTAKINNNDINSTNLADYSEGFRAAETPWVVSEVMGQGDDLELKKLFRFITITDGVYANKQVKISIANVKPDAGTFDVYIRDFNDSDANISILESYRNLTMRPGDLKYIGRQIGTLNGDYELKSKYVYVEINEDDVTKECIPCGFIGYPLRTYESTIKLPVVKYNTDVYETIRPRRQFFGFSDITGVDNDIFSYKGAGAYTEKYNNGYSNGFHFDIRLSKVSGDTEYKPTIKIEGEVISGMGWSTVEDAIIFDSETSLVGTVLEDVNFRKFTLYPYGGFDGWDVFRKSRTTGDKYNAINYAVDTKSAYRKIFNGDGLNLPANSITSDYYAFLAGVKQFEDNEQHVINLLATPGIDYVNQPMLVNEVIEMLEEKRQDTFYVVTTPDKPAGATDAVEEMFSSSDAVANLEDSQLDTWYASTYYPWVKYFDGENNQYINLPATKDVLRNMAEIDNKRYPWFAAAGTSRGKVDCVKLHSYPKIEDEDTLYDGGINPLKYFSRDGVLVWGNKTLYTNDSPLNRINVARLILYMRRLIIDSSRPLLFEPNDLTLKKQFNDTLDSILRDIKSNRGIFDYRLSVSQTAEQIDAHEISAVLAVKPTQTLEYIEIEFEVTPQGVDFADQ